MRRYAALLITLLACSLAMVCSGCAQTYHPKGKTLPDNFKINCYSPSVCTQSDSTPLPGKESQQIVVLTTDDDVKKVIEWYKTELVFKGYRVLSDNDHKGAITLESESDKYHCTVNVLSVVGKKTVISISVFPKPK